MSFFGPLKFPEPFKPEPLWQMHTCPDCKNDLVCHDQGERLRPTPETDAFAKAMYASGVDCHHDGRKAIERAKQFERQLAEAREENARLREAINLAETHLCYIANDDSAGWDSRDEAKQGLIQLHRALTP